MDEQAPVSLASRRRRGLLLSERRLLTAALDSLAAATALGVAYNLRTTEVRNIGLSIPRLGTVVCVVLFLVSGWLVGAYEVSSLISIRRALQSVLTAVGFTFAGLLLTFFLVPYRITRPTILLWVPLAVVLVMVVRLLAQRLGGPVTAATPVALLASPAVDKIVNDELQPAMDRFYDVVAVLDPTDPGTTEALLTLAGDRRISAVIVGVRDDVPRPLFTALLDSHENGVSVRSLASVYEELTGRTLLDQLGHSWLMSLPMRADTSRLYGAFKRLTDMVAAAIALAVLVVVLIPCAMLIKLTSPGPLFHRQLRIGKYGRPFRIVKLRTMRVGDSLDWTEAKDARITGVGRFLRLLHLDELPQGWNILRGDMSVIGPRPEQPQYVTQLREQIDFYSSRLVVRPGLTGWAQVNHGYGSGVEGTRVKLSYDLYYVKNQSVSLDALILVRTLFTILTFRGM